MSTAPSVDDIRNARPSSTASSRLAAAQALIVQQEQDIAALRREVESLRAEIRSLGGQR